MRAWFPLSNGSFRTTRKNIVNTLNPPTRTSLIAASILAVALTGCANMTETQKGTATGAGVGALAGVIIGDSKGGAAIGAAAGGAAGKGTGEVVNPKPGDKSRP